MEFKDYYQTLGIAKTASEKEIKQAYRKLARKFHPDVNPGDKAAEGRFKEINEAYEVLGDPEKRKKYDELGANWRYYEQAQQAGQGSPFQGTWSTGSGGYRTINEEDLRDLFGGENPFSDFFQAFFGGGQPEPGRRTRSSRGSRSRTGRDVEQEIDLSLEEALRGTTKRLQIKQEGHTRTVDVRIPVGVTDGSRVRVPGEGEQAGGGRAGDLYLRIRLRPDSRFERKGRDLQTQISVPVTTAVLGGEAEVPTVGDRPLRLKIPPTTQNGQVFRLKGHGMPAVGKPAERGDLYATVNVVLPRQLSDEQRRHYEELAKLE
ncbi:MAG: J domain-containing protein [Acidobacteria bacterium]|nr:MAG: J domain-containing protein [Acidobacteriota bacterium]